MPRPMRPEAGEMNTPIVILSDIESADPSGYGEAVPGRTPKQIASRWAKDEPQSSREFFRASQMYGVLSHLLTIDYLAALTIKMKVRLTRQNRTLNIVGIVDVGNQQVIQQVACVEAV